MTPRAKQSGPNLFTAAGLDKATPRPRADKLRPRKLSEVVGQDRVVERPRAVARVVLRRHLRAPGLEQPAVAERAVADAEGARRDGEATSRIADLKK